MKRKFPVAISVALVLAITVPSMAFAAVLPAHITFTADTPCSATVIVSTYTDPSNQPGVEINGSTPFTLDVYPSTPVTFYYPAFVVCNGTTYNFVSLISSDPNFQSGGISGGEDSTITVTGQYTAPVSDTTAPTWEVPDSFSIEATSPAGATVNYSASASDVDDDVSSQSCLPASNTTFTLGKTTVNCTATDTHSNTGTAHFDVTVVDTTAPALTLPSNMTTTAVNASGAPVSFTASANDVVDGAVAVICTPPSGSVFPIGTTTVNCTVTDTHGNTSSGHFDVTVVDAPPVLALPDHLIVTAMDASGAPVSFTASAMDTVDGALPVTCVPASGSQFPIGTTTVNCSATDSHGNKVSGSFTVTVQYASAGVKCGGIAGHQILSPINLDGSSVFKLGRTVPVRFRVCGTDGVPIGTLDVIRSFRLIKIISKGTVSNVDQPVLAITPTILFHSANQQWLFNISTKLLSAGKTYVYLITLNDGSTIQFQFSLK